MNKKAQGALEYLLLISGAVLVAAVVITLAVAFTGGAEVEEIPRWNSEWECLEEEEISRKTILVSNAEIEVPLDQYENLNCKDTWSECYGDWNAECYELTNSRINCCSGSGAGGCVNWTYDEVERICVKRHAIEVYN